VLESHAQVERLYALDRDVGFDPSGTPDPGAEAFAVARLAVGATFLRDFWWSAWVASAP
jgi:hypothetical protein